MIVSRPLLLGALVLGLLATGLPASTAAAGKKKRPVPQHLESLSVGAAKEFRLAVLHPVFGPKLTATEHDIEAAAQLEPDVLGLTVRRGTVDMVNFKKSRALLLPGEVLRGPKSDLATETFVTTEGSKRSPFRVRAVSEEQRSDAPAQEPRVMGDLLPPTLRWYATHGTEKDLRKHLRDWTKTVKLKTARKSVLDLATAEPLKKRFDEYEKALTGTTKAPAGTALVGYALLVDGDLAQIETFSAPKLLEAWWPRIVRSVALECTVLEAQHSLLEQEMPAAVDPDRHLAKVKERLLSLYASKAKKSKLPAVGERWLLEAPKDTTAHVLILDNQVAQMFVAIRPDRRKDIGKDETMDPGTITRKKRPTEAEKRWLERRKQRDPPIPTPPPTPGNTGGGSGGGSGSD